MKYIERHLEVALGALWDGVLVALVLDLEVQGLELVDELLADRLLNRAAGLSFSHDAPLEYTKMTGGDYGEVTDRGAGGRERDSESRGRRRLSDDD